MPNPPYNRHETRARLVAELQSLGIPRLNAETDLPTKRPNIPLEELTSGRAEADGDAGTATMYAVNLALHEDRGGTTSLTVAELWEDYAADLLRELGGSPERALAAARAVAVGAVDSTRYPMLWRQAALAVELCQRAAEIAGEVLPGSYRPGSRAGIGSNGRQR